MVTVTATGHGLVTGDWVVQTEVGGAVEAQGLFKVTKVDANSYTLDGLTAVTAYTSGGVAKKVTVSGLLRDIKPYQFDALKDALSRVKHVRNHDAAAGSGESTVGTILATVTP